ncbi:histidine phosphatase family protein [Lacisediminihabitans sp.]|uniref:histidine phosphatase family protein n=1 Tax=Lacisediminihabitans sp. TaxID=2787631 RepID=UPI002F928FCD
MPTVFITHPEVVIDPAVSIEQWGLSAVGHARAERLPAILMGQVDWIVSSTERKATDTAAVLAAGLGVPAAVDPVLGEMDRTATGYLPPDEFDTVVELFFAEPEQSIRGWERAVDAQHRIADTIRRHSSNGHANRTAFVSHGGVGALLLASLTGSPISRSLDQPGLGSYFTFDALTWTALSGWNRIPPS